MEKSLGGERGEGEEEGRSSCTIRKEGEEEAGAEEGDEGSSKVKVSSMRGTKKELFFLDE